MAPEFRYSLTRICLRTGQLSLSQRMAEVFPAAGTFRALDTLDDRELELRVDEPRKISGLAAFLERHRLEVNDQIQVRRSDDGRIVLTAMPRSRRSFDERAVRELIDTLVGEKPRTEEEIRALHPQIPSDYPLGEALAAHPGLRLRGGRWVGEGETEVTSVQAPVKSHDEAEQAMDERPARDRAEPDSPANRDSRRSRDRSQPRRAAAVTPYPRGVMFPGEAALNSQRPAGDLRFVNRAREALAGFGYRVEGLPHGMLLAKADLGRRKHSVLVRVLADGERLDWAALLARRREMTADYLAVVGDHRDLHRLTAPAELARATLWSWDGIARVQNLAHTILIGPFDLEPHFAKDGMFESGLHLFERSVGRMITEKGALSAVIARLASLRAPAVFVLDDIAEDAVDGGLQREQVAKSLELLAQAPFHLIARVDRGEYCLRHTVAESLAHLSEYALSLGERLPGARGRQTRLISASEAGAEERQDRSGELGKFEMAEDLK